MKYYSIHGIVGISVDDEYPWNETLLVNIKMFICTKKEYENCNGKIDIKYKKNISTEESYEVVPNLYLDKLKKKIIDIKFGAQMEFRDNHIILSCYQECNEWLMVCLSYLLIYNGYTFLHAAAVAKDGSAFILPSWGGVGKTASVVKLIREHDYQLLGDDLVILGRNGDVYAFPKVFVLYAYHKNLFPEILSGPGRKGHLVSGKLSSVLSKILPQIKILLRNVPGLLSFARRHNPQAYRITPFKIFKEEQIAIKARLASAMWLERLYIKETITVPITHQLLASKSVMIMIHELFDGCISNAIIALCGECISHEVLFDKSVEIAKSAIENVPVCQLHIPVEYPIESVADDVVKLVLNSQKNYLEVR
jgi:hypothetical protein